MLPKFEPIESIPATKRNFAIKFIFSLMVLAFFGMLIMSVYCLLFEYSSLYVFTFLLSGILCFGVAWRFLYHYPVHIKFRVDEMGLHKIKSGLINETKSILYKDLVNVRGEIKPKNTTYGLFLKTEGRNRKVFEIYSLDKSNKIITTRDNFMGDISTNALFRNHRKMLATYLLGVTTFRPYIQIDPALFHYFFIDEKTFEHDAKEQTQTYLYVFAFVFFVMAVLGLILFNLTN